MTEKKSRIAWVDLVEALAIYFVILYHGPLYQWNFFDSLAPTNSVIYYLFNTILSTAVPLFFLVNGYLLFSKKFDFKKHYHKTIRLFVLALIWQCISAAFYVAINEQPSSIKSFVFGIWDNWQRWTPHLWFIEALFCIYILFPIFKTVYDNNQKIFTYLVGMVALFTFGSTLLGQGMSVVNAMFPPSAILSSKNLLGLINPFIGMKWWTVVYFCLGGIAFSHRERIASIAPKVRNLISIAGIVVSCILLFGLGLFYSYTNGAAWDIVFDAYGTIFTLCNTICIFLLSLNYTTNNKFIITISRNTLGIYFLHMFVIRLTISVASKMPTLLVFTFPTSLLYSFGVLCISLGISLIWQKVPILKKLL